MRRMITILFILAVAMLPAAAFAGQIWTDGNGDGLQDSGKFIAPPSTNVTVGVYIDTQSFNFSYFQGWIQRAPCLSFVSGTYVISGGTNFPIDNFTHPQRTGLAGSGYPNRHGIIFLGNLVFHVETPLNCCVVPSIDGGDAPYSILGNNATGGYQFFTSAFGTCFEFVNSTEPTSWGNIKGLYQ